MTKIISLGGSIIVQDKININFLKKFRDLIIKHSKKERIIIVTGGGKVCRDYINAAKKFTKKNHNLDLVGVRSTRLNAELVRTTFGDKAYHEVAINPNKKIKTNKKILIGSGWKPGTSSDFDAVMLAKTFNADKIINLSNIKFVYDKDPKKFKLAKPIKKLSWKDFRKIIGDKWVAGRNVPFDPVASKKAQSLKLKVIIAKGTNLKNLKNILEDKKFTGTLIE